MNEIVPARPGSISMWIFPLYACILIVVLTTLWSIHHPEIVNTKAQLTGRNGPDNSLTVEIDIPENYFYKIDSGQQVQLRFYEYPYLQFGVVTGKLQQVSAVHFNKTVTARVLLPDGLVTNHQQVIPYKEGSKVDLMIITRDMRLLQRIFYKSAKVTRPQPPEPAVN